jgi:hypothetical protein
LKGEIENKNQFSESKKKKVKKKRTIIHIKNKNNVLIVG